MLKWELCNSENVWRWHQCKSPFSYDLFKILNFISHLGWSTVISNFPRFHKNVNWLHSFNLISAESSPERSFWRNKRKFEFSVLSSDAPNLQAVVLNLIEIWNTNIVPATMSFLILDEFITEMSLRRAIHTGDVGHIFSHFFGCSAGKTSEHTIHIYIQFPKN